MLSSVFMVSAQHTPVSNTRQVTPGQSLPGRPLQWLMLFGPGAIIASLTIGTGELIFSSRGGAIFGYRVLFLFVIISLLKWGLVVAASRHIVLTGVHPYQRMVELPGPRGWFPLVLFLIAAVALPIWISFHSGVLGNLLAWLTGTSESLGGAADYVWGTATLTVVMTIALVGGYTTLERIQLLIVAAMLLGASVTLIIYRPDWVALLLGAVVPRSFAYPSWLSTEYPHIAAQPVWVETTRYVGVIGGAAFDYMAYTSFVRDKHWGLAALAPSRPANCGQLPAILATPCGSGCVLLWSIVPSVSWWSFYSRQSSLRRELLSSVLITKSRTNRICSVCNPNL